MLALTSIAKRYATVARRDLSLVDSDTGIARDLGPEPEISTSLNRQVEDFKKYSSTWNEINIAFLNAICERF